ncbi:MAG: hypothetical protein KDA44_10330 [Planctomycetales bacterium]|nr:hypothetical protein [Planctomycetales bacterium]
MCPPDADHDAIEKRIAEAEGTVEGAKILQDFRDYASRYIDKRMKSICEANEIAGKKVVNAYLGTKSGKRFREYFSPDHAQIGGFVLKPIMVEDKGFKSTYRPAGPGEPYGHTWYSL